MKFVMSVHFYSLILCAIFATPALAQQKTIYYQLSTGTGFVINREGHVVTNAHVVRDCQSISILTPRGEEEATLEAKDAEQDLAVLKTAYISPSIAPLRWNISELKVGDEVTVIGYPGERSNTGKHLSQKTRILNLEGPTGQKQWIQLKSVATHGSSGGPVLDASGNVIAVISGMAQVYRQDGHGNPTGPMLRQTDYAITLAALQDFLREHGIGFYESVSNSIGYNYTRSPTHVRDFIVPIRCVQDTQIHYR